MAPPRAISVDAILRGLFGALVASAEAGESTAQVWSGLRAGAADWAANTLAITLGRPPDATEVAAAAKTLLAGVSAADVSRWRGIAGQYVAAKGNLTSRMLGSQIFGDAIFRPPWSVTDSNPAVTERYRIRVNWLLQYKGFETVELSEWNTYDLTGPLTSVQDALDQARAAFEQASYNTRTSIKDVLDYSIEVV